MILGPIYNSFIEIIWDPNHRLFIEKYVQRRYFCNQVGPQEILEFMNYYWTLGPNLSVIECGVNQIVPTLMSKYRKYSFLAHLKILRYVLLNNVQLKGPIPSILVVLFTS